ncbi:MAG TPA: polysaccharide biosynthesis protein [Candidatus Paceibacterota bacterium]|nr:polysaccharide biosynthesis protein [Candidatus Paceibacterota bacterium]
MLKNEKIFITGGAGYLGGKLVRRFYADNEVTIFSRDEAKHYYLKKQFPKVRCIIGDVRNAELLKRSVAGHTVAIFAASLKQIEAVDQNVEEAEQVIVHGAINSRNAAVENNLKSASFISTDKSRCATTLYGAMKFVAGESFILNAEDESCKLTSVIYGNVLNSTGSIIPLIWDSIKRGYPLTLYSEHMTRFMIDIDDAIECIEYGLDKTGFNIVPDLPSFKVKDLFEIYEEAFGLSWNLGVPRISEKTHEQMISPYEKERAMYDEVNKKYLLHYREVYNESRLPASGLSSEDCVISKESLKELLAKYDFFKP